MKDVKRCTRRIRTRYPMISNPTLTTRPPTAAAESTENLWYLCTVLINVYVAGPDPDPNHRGGGQLPNPKSAILR